MIVCFFWGGGGEGGRGRQGCHYGCGMWNVDTSLKIVKIAGYGGGGGGGGLGVGIGIGIGWSEV